jgi:plasmid stabilization system protein ParE
MAYLVNITSRAERDLAQLYRKINAEHSDAALRWYQGLKEAILSLEEHPNRCPVIPERTGSGTCCTAISLMFTA